ELSSAYEGALMLVPVVAGSNHVELKFMPPGLVIGCAVSGVSLLLAAFVGISRRAQMAVLH
ncbi:MAG: hypothetical protein Q4B54_00145, partial [Coriobacteriales bacterium]|nr:hypothetical protein [Coriobacteriales bacterium]